MPTSAAGSVATPCAADQNIADIVARCLRSHSALLIGYQVQRTRLTKAKSTPIQKPKGEAPEECARK